MEISIDQIPTYLRTSTLFGEIIDLGDDDTTIITALHCKPNTTILNDGDLEKLLHTLKFWVVPEIDYPIEVYNYILTHREELNYVELNRINSKVMNCPAIQFLIHLDQYVGLKTTAAARYGYIKSLQVLHENDFPWDANTCKAAA